MELCKYPELGKVRTFHIEAIQIPIVYNKYGDYDPDGLLYVLEEDAERIQREAVLDTMVTAPQTEKSGIPGMLTQRGYICFMIWQIPEAPKTQPTFMDCLELLL